MVTNPSKPGTPNGGEKAEAPGEESRGSDSTATAIRDFATAFLRELHITRQRRWQPENDRPSDPTAEESLPSLEARYRVLVEQIPAVVFMAFLDGGVSEAYVSPQIEQMLGFSQEEWLDDPVRWFQQIHPDDRARWSAEAAETFVIGKPLKSVYRVIARDGRVVWFHCEAKLVRKKNGDPWFIHGVGFDVTELKETEEALKRESAERLRLQKLELERQIAKAEQTESRLAAIVESSDDAIMGKSLDGTITTWNAAAARLLGYEPGDILGKSILTLVPPELHEEEMYILRQLSEGEHIEHRETQRVTRNGARVDVSLTISPIRDATGQVIGGSTIARDITDRKRSEQALRASEERFRSLSACSPVGIFLTDIQGLCSYTNTRCESICGFTSEQALGEGWTRFVHPDERDRVVQEWADAAHHGREFSQEVRWANGRWTRVQSAPLFSDQGQPMGYVGTVEDVTERKVAVEALRESEERFRTMADPAADAIFRIDAQSTILFTNRAAEQIFLYRVEEMVGQNLTILMPEYLREIHRAAVERYLRTGARHVDWERVEVTGLRKDGREISLELSLGESVKDDQYLFTGFVRDVTERKHMEKKLRVTEKLAATGRLAATISHEINNPLEAVTNMIYLARHDASLSGQAHRWLEGADRELQRVAHIARQTLGFDHDTTSPVTVNVSEILSEILELYRGKIVYKNLRVDMRLDRLCEVHAFQGEIRQVFSNVLANAIEASHEGGPLILRVSAARSWKTPDVIGVRIRIADRGRGIPPHARSKIFEPFYSTKESIGTGPRAVGFQVAR